MPSLPRLVLPAGSAGSPLLAWAASQAAFLRQCELKFQALRQALLLASQGADVLSDVVRSVSAALPHVAAPGGLPDQTARLAASQFQVNQAIAENFRRLAAFFQRFGLCGSFTPQDIPLIGLPRLAARMSGVAPDAPGTADIQRLAAGLQLADQQIDRNFQAVRAALLTHQTSHWLCPGSPGLRPFVGFDLTRWFTDPITFTGLSVLEDVATVNLGRLAQCQLVLAGVSFRCNDPVINFREQDWPLIGSYIRGGGRLWLQAEYFPCISLEHISQLRDFLSAIGASLRFLGGVYDGDCSLSGLRDCIPGPARIAQNLPVPVRMAATAEVGGGTTVFFSPSGVRMIVAEPLGNGIFFLAGDSNVLTNITAPAFCNYPIAGPDTFFTRMVTWSVSDML